MPLWHCAETIVSDSAADVTVVRLADVPFRLRTIIVIVAAAATVDRELLLTLLTLRWGVDQRDRGAVGKYSTKGPWISKHASSGRSKTRARKRATRATQR